MSVRSRLTVGDLIDWLADKPRDAIVDPDMHCVGIRVNGHEELQFNYRYIGGKLCFYPYKEIPS